MRTVVVITTWWKLLLDFYKSIYGFFANNDNHHVVETVSEVSQQLLFVHLRMLCRRSNLHTATTTCTSNAIICRPSALHAVHLSSHIHKHSKTCATHICAAVRHPDVLYGHTWTVMLPRRTYETFIVLMACSHAACCTHPLAFSTAPVLHTFIPPNNMSFCSHHVLLCFIVIDCLLPPSTRRQTRYAPYYMKHPQPDTPCLVIIIAPTSHSSITTEPMLPSTRHHFITVLCDSFSHSSDACAAT